MTDSPISISVSSEYGTLRTVVMRLATPFNLDLSRPEMFDRGFQRQLEHNHWETYDHLIVREQQEAFIDAMRSRGVDVLLADEVVGCDGQHYTRDIGFAIDDIFIVARSRLTVRQRELIGMRAIIERMTNVAFLDAGIIEGGDVILAEGAVLVGLGEETSPVGIEALEYRLRSLGNERELVPIAFTHRGVVHLDTKFNVVGPNLAFVHLASFTPESVRALEARFELIEATTEEMDRIEINTFSLAPDAVVLSARSDRLAGLLQERGITPIPVDYSEVTRIPGSFRCSTMPLLRDPV